MNKKETPPPLDWQDFVMMGFAFGFFLGNLLGTYSG
jgi:hypothetical protein